MGATEARGRIVRSLSGFYTVEIGAGSVSCKAAGIFRRTGVTPLVGDIVRLDVVDDGSGVIREVLPRRNSFVRPMVANIDMMVMIASEVPPVTDPYLIDRASALAAYHGCGFLLCVNKTDLSEEDRLFEIYRSAGIPVIRTSAPTGVGIGELSAALAGKVCAFAGNSGVGKTSLINALAPELGLRTGEISEKLRRGKHTTRHVELFPIGNDSYLADTPGFGAFELDQAECIGPEELPGCFPEFSAYTGTCRFDDCRHAKEPGCAVREAVESGRIPPSRYGSYLRLLEESLRTKAREYK